ncbi:MAG TPA: Uma2 family endonuclease [Verrucomicrobiae bacterium]|nr:Uma2 family endonuclease [Verrucomicrobiae bacterium]
MNVRYEEIVAGESLIRMPPSARHEIVCARLHSTVAASLEASTTSRLLKPRTVVQVSPGSLVRPDLVLVTAANSKPWLVAEVIHSGDHSSDTVTKKMMYEECRLPRLWMIDLRYDNVEVYHGTQYGMTLKDILAGRDFLTEKLLPNLNLAIAELFVD